MQIPLNATAVEVEGIANGQNSDVYFDDFAITSAPAPMPTDVLKLGDITGPSDVSDGKVDSYDFKLFVHDFNRTGPNVGSDFDRNGIVDIFDYNLLVGNFGK